MYVKPENDIYPNRKITSMAYLLTWKSEVIGTIMATRLSSRFRAKCLESNSSARDMIVSATNGMKIKLYSADSQSHLLIDRELTLEGNHTWFTDTTLTNILTIT